MGGEGVGMCMSMFLWIRCGRDGRMFWLIEVVMIVDDLNTGHKCHFYDFEIQRFLLRNLYRGTCNRYKFVVDMHYKKPISGTLTIF